METANAVAIAILSITDMQCAYHALGRHLQQGLASLYIITGREAFLMDQATQQIKAVWRKKNHDPDDPEALDCQYRELKGTVKEWESLQSDLNSLSLFTKQTLYQVRFDKKTLDKTARGSLQQFVESNDTANILLLQTPLLKAKDVAQFQKHANVAVVSLYPLNDRDFQQWIYRALQQHFPSATPAMAALIAQYTQGNLFAADQAIQKLSLLLDKNQKLSLAVIESQLHNQSDFQAFELSDACLVGDAPKAVQIIRQLTLQSTEAPLLLWVMTNDIRQLLRLNARTTNQTWRDACQALKIWPSKSPLYQQAAKRVNESTLRFLHRQARLADASLKSGQSVVMKNTLEQIALGLCYPEKVSAYA